jgi:hypothetical protein
VTWPEPYHIEGIGEMMHEEPVYESVCTVAAKGEVLHSSEGSGVDRLAAWILERHPLNLQSTLVLSRFVQECQTSILFSKASGLSYAGPIGSLSGWLLRQDSLGT